MSHNDYLCEEDQAEGAFDAWACWCSPDRYPAAGTCPKCGCPLVEVDGWGERVQISPLGAGM